jgi:hypothetical protein
LPSWVCWFNKTYFTIELTVGFISVRVVILEEPLLSLPILSTKRDPLEGSGELEDIGPILDLIKSSLEGLGLTLSKEMDLLYAKQIVYSIFKKTRQKAYSTTSA